MKNYDSGNVNQESKKVEHVDVNNAIYNIYSWTWLLYNFLTLREIIKIVWTLKVNNSVSEGNFTRIL